MSPAPAPVSLAFLMFPGFPMACLTSAIEPLRVANEITGRKVFFWTLIGEEAGAVRSSAEVGFDPDATLATAAQPDYLFLLSAPDARFASARTPALIRGFERRGCTVGAFSGGIFPLARSGVMEGYLCSVHWCYEAAFAAEFPRIEATQSAIERDRRRITVSGAGAVFDLMLRLIGERLGAGIMSEVACWFQHPFVRDEEASQTMPVARVGGTEAMLPPIVRKAVQIFEHHIDTPIAIGDVAARVAVCERQLIRRFREATGQSPLRYYRMMRLKRARQRVLYSNDPMTDIACSVGYSSTSVFTDYYRRAFGLTPREERARQAGLRGLTGTVPPAEPMARSEDAAGRGFEGVQERRS